MNQAVELVIRNKYKKLTELLIEKKKTITTMESCTSGQVASLITDTEGSSAIIKGAFITYSNEAKIMQGVPARVIEEFGVYSLQTAAEMAKCCRNTFGADIGIGVTGSFGNVDPNNKDSVPGEVFFAMDTVEGTKVFHEHVPAQNSRLGYKLVMADKIADVIIDYIK